MDWQEQYDNWTIDQEAKEQLEELRLSASDGQSSLKHLYDRSTTSRKRQYSRFDADFYNDDRL